MDSLNVQDQLHVAKERKVCERVIGSIRLDNVNNTTASTYASDFHVADASCKVAYD